MPALWERHRRAPGNHLVTIASTIQLCNAIRLILIPMFHNTLKKTTQIFSSSIKHKGYLPTKPLIFYSRTYIQYHLSPPFYRINHCSQWTLNMTHSTHFGGYLDNVQHCTVTIIIIFKRDMLCDIAGAYLCNFMWNPISQHFPVEALLGHVIGDAAGSLEGIFQPFQFHISD